MVIFPKTVHLSFSEGSKFFYQLIEKCVDVPVSLRQRCGGEQLNAREQNSRDDEYRLHRWAAECWLTADVCDSGQQRVWLQRVVQNASGASQSKPSRRAEAERRSTRRCNAMVGDGARTNELVQNQRSVYDDEFSIMYNYNEIIEKIKQRGYFIVKRDKFVYRSCLTYVVFPRIL